jgi:hypothetical protein
VQSGVSYILKFGGYRASRMQRSATLALACLAVALCNCSPAFALPLASDRPTTVAIPSNSLDSPAVPGISIWNFVHPGSLDREEPAVEPMRIVRNAPAAIQPMWVAVASAQDPFDSSFEATEIGDVRSGCPGTLPSRLSYSTHGSVRRLPGGSRVQRTDRETDVAVSSVSANFSLSSETRLAGNGYRNPEALLVSRLFRPPRAEIRLP